MLGAQRLMPVSVHHCKLEETQIQTKQEEQAR